MSYTVQNPSADREFVANVGGVWYQIPAGESMTTDDPRVATTLGEYGAGLSTEDTLDALDEHAAMNRYENALHGSAPASEGSIMGAQVTVDAATGTVERSGIPAAPTLRGEALDQALRDAGLSTSGSADEKRARLAEWQAEDLEIPVEGAGGTGEPAFGASARMEGDPAPDERDPDPVTP